MAVKPSDNYDDLLLEKVENIIDNYIVSSAFEEDRKDYPIILKKTGICRSLNVNYDFMIDDSVFWQKIADKYNNVGWDVQNFTNELEFYKKEN